MAAFDAETAESAEIDVRAALGARQLEVLGDDALRFLGALHRRFEDQRQRLIKLRESRDARFGGNAAPKFPAATQHIRDGDWTIAPWPSDLDGAAVILSGPADRRALLEGLNSGADIYIADLADATAHGWSVVIDAQINLLDRWDGRLEETDARSGRTWRLSDNAAVLMVRPRAWDLDDPKLRIGGAPISASLFDFGLYAFHTAHKAVAAGSTVHFAFAALANSQEARLWDDVLRFAHEHLALPPGTFRALPALETLTAVHEIDEILYEMRDHAMGLYLGAANLAVSYIATLRADAARILPDTAHLGRNGDFVAASCLLMRRICRRRGARAFGGTVAATDGAVDSHDMRYARAVRPLIDAPGLDGIVVTAPDAVAAALRAVKARNDRALPDDDGPLNGPVPAVDLLGPSVGELTEDGLRAAIRLGLSYLDGWLRGQGSTTIDGTVFNAADADLARAWVWQQLQHAARLSDGRVVDPALVGVLIEDELFAIRNRVGADAYARGRYPQVQKIFRALVFAPDFAPHITHHMGEYSE